MIVVVIRTDDEARSVLIHKMSQWLAKAIPQPFQAPKVETSWFTDKQCGVKHTTVPS